MQFTLTESRALKVLCALIVFFCHVTPYVNTIGFIPVSVFFFISGYGFSVSDKNVLLRVPRLMMAYSFAVVVYSLVYGELHLVFPVSWYFAIYGLQILLFWMLPRWWFVLSVNFAVSVAMWYSGEFTYPWWASMVGFPLGMLASRIPSRIGGFPFCAVLLAGVCGLLFTRGFPLFMWFVTVPMCLAMIGFGRTVQLLSQFYYLTMPFFLFHCLVLDMCGVRHGLGLEPMGGIVCAIMLSFIGSVAFSYLVYKLFQKSLK